MGGWDKVEYPVLTDYNSSGGFYSNTVDMLAFGISILSSRLISPLKTRRWLKPAGSTSQTGLLLGAPWEIYRSDELTQDGRLIELYTKSGDMGVYHTKLCLVPDYDVVINVMTSGIESDAELPNRLCSDVAKALLPAVEAAGKREAEALAGTYADAASNSSLVLALDDGPGFLVRTPSTPAVRSPPTAPSSLACIPPTWLPETRPRGACILTRGPPKSKPPRTRHMRGRGVVAPPGLRWIGSCTSSMTWGILWSAPGRRSSWS